MLKKLTVRNDSWGGGHFNSSRAGGSRLHKGTDYVVTEGEPIYAPEPCEIIREARPYTNNPNYSGLLLVGESGLEYKIFYMKPIMSKIGGFVKEGELIGHAQAISELYSPEMTDHIHVYVYQNGERIDPEPIIKKKAPNGTSYSLLDSLSLAFRYLEERKTHFEKWAEENS